MLNNQAIVINITIHNSKSINKIEIGEKSRIIYKQDIPTTSKDYTRGIIKLEYSYSIFMDSI